MTANYFKKQFLYWIFYDPYIRMTGKIISIFLMLNIFFPASSQNSGKEPLKIGFLIQSQQHTEASNGVKLAITLINNSGGINGRKMEPVFRSMEGPWGTGARESVNLIFDEEALAIVGSVDGRNSHLIEQACTKTGVLFISCLSADPTLAQAFVPWFFNCVPNDIQQTQTLVNEIFTLKNFSRIAIVKDNQYDSNNSLKYFERAYKQYIKETKASLKVYDRLEATEMAGTIQTIISGNHDCLILFCSSEIALQIINALKSKNIQIPVYSNIYLACEEGQYADELRRSGVTIYYPFPERNPEKYPLFREKYKKEFGRNPGIAAELAFDAVTLLALVASNTQHEREDMQKFLYSVKFEGVTGTLSFDERGNRKGTFKIYSF